jgi:allantoicase
MEIRTFDPEDVKGVATSGARSITADQIDSTFKSQYTGMIVRTEAR